MTARFCCLGVTLLLAAAPGAAANEQAFRSDDGTCQVLVPADWAIDTAPPMARGGGFTVMVLHEQDAKVEKADPAMIEAVYGAKRIFENTNERLFVESETVAIGPIPASRKWQSLVPAKPKGACQVIVVFKSPSASEEIARGIVLSLGQAK